MPYWSIYCLYCNGYIVDALLECLPAGNRLHPGFKRKHRFTQPGTHDPLTDYTYAEDAPPDETVP